MRICILSNHYPPNVIGGAELSVAALARGLAQRHEVCVITRNTTAHLMQEERDGVSVTRVPGFSLRVQSNPWRDLQRKIRWRVANVFDAAQHRRIAREIEAFSPDIVHLNNLELMAPRIASRIARRGIPVVQTVRDYRALCESMMLKNGLPCPQQCQACRRQKTAVRRAYADCSHLVSISRHIRQTFLREGYAQTERSTVIYNGVEDLTNPNAASPDYAIGFIGALTSLKGTERLIAIAKAMPEHRFAVATQSDPVAIERFRQPAPANIDILGQQEPIAFFSRVRCVVVPSQWEEPFGRVAAEALSAGRPVVVSNRGGLPEIVEDGVQGYVLPHDQTDQWVGTLQRLLADEALCERMGQAGREHWQHHFSARAMVEQYEALFQKLVAHE